MYIDLIILGIFIVFIIIYSKKFQNFIFGIAALDILFRIISFINTHLLKGNITDYIDAYLPSSISNIISKYTNGTIEELLIWLYVIIMSIFLYFVCKIFIERKKIN